MDKKRSFKRFASKPKSKPIKLRTTPNRQNYREVQFIEDSFQNHPVASVDDHKDNTQQHLISDSETEELMTEQSLYVSTQKEII